MPITTQLEALMKGRIDELEAALRIALHLIDGPPGFGETYAAKTTINDLKRVLDDSPIKQRLMEQ